MARRPLVLRKQFKTSRHRCPLDISIFENNHATLPRQIPVQRGANQPDDSATNPPNDSVNNQPDDSTTNQPGGGDGNNNGTTVAMEGPVLSHNFGLRQGFPGLKRRRRVAIECPGLFKLPCPRPDYVPKYDKSRPWKATEGTVVVIGPLPGNLNRPSPSAAFNRPSPLPVNLNRPSPFTAFNRPSPFSAFNQTMSQTTTATIAHSMASSDETGTSDQQSASTYTDQTGTDQTGTDQTGTCQPGTYQTGTYQPYGYPFTSTYRQGLSASDTESPCSKAPSRVTRPPPHAYHTSVMETPLSHSESPLVPSIGQGQLSGQVHPTVPAVTSLKQVPGHLPPFPARRRPLATRMAPSAMETAGTTTQAPHPGKTQKPKVSKELKVSKEPKVSKEREVVDLELECPTAKIRPSLQNFKLQNIDRQVASGQDLAPPFMIHFPPLHLRED